MTDTALYGVKEASDFADRAEQLSRMADYLQLVAAGAVDRTRSRAAAQPAGSVAGPGAPAGWLAGWNTDEAIPPAPADGPAAAPECLDDGYRSPAEFLRARLGISVSEARRRLPLAANVLPRTGIAGQLLPEVREELAAAVAAGTVASRAATIITLALDNVRSVCPPQTAARMEHDLTVTAVENFQDFLHRIARRWSDALDQDGAEPDETELRQRQGAFVRRPRRGLQHVEIFATTDQFEHLATVMNIGTSPRTGPATGPQAGPPNGSDGADATSGGEAAAEGLDQRSRPQRLLDGLVGACKVALAAGGLSAAGGLRP